MCLNTNIDTKLIAKNFAKAHATYGNFAIVQQQMCHTLIHLLLLNLPNIHPTSVLEIGCGVGNLTDIYTDIWTLDDLYLNDLYDVKLNISADFLIGDIESLDLPMVDMVLSSSALQWIKDLPSLCKKIHQALPKGGVFAFASFGKNNLAQIKALTNIGLDYHGLDDITTILKATNFDIIATHQSQEVLYFDHPKDVLRHIKNTGVAMGGMTWTKSSLKSFYENYHATFAVLNEGKWRYALTYDTIYLIAIKP